MIEVLAARVATTPRLIRLVNGTYDNIPYYLATMQAVADTQTRLAPRYPVLFDRGLFVRGPLAETPVLVHYIPLTTVRTGRSEDMSLFREAEKATTRLLKASAIVAIKEGWLVDLWIADESGAASSIA